MNELGSLTYPVVNKFRPEASKSMFVGIVGQMRALLPLLVNVLQYHQRLGQRLLVMDKNWNLFVHRVVLQQQRTLTRLLLA